MHVLARQANHWLSDDEGMGMVVGKKGGGGEEAVYIHK